MASPAEGPLSAGPRDRSRLIVVTGLPRSGTSMAMRMLGAGGLPLVDDGRRAPGPDNPHGWFEDERVRRLREDSSWLRGAVGSAVKIVLPLASAIPGDLPCDFVWMRRPVEEVLASQRRMLAPGFPARGPGAAGGSVVGDPDAEESLLSRAFERATLDFERCRAPGRRVLALDYADVLLAPARAADAIASLVGEPFDRLEATRAVDRSLGRSTPRRTIPGRRPTT